MVSRIFRPPPPDKFKKLSRLLGRRGAWAANRFAGGLVVALNGADETSFLECKRRAGGAR